MDITPGRALFVLERLIADKRVTRSEVNRLARDVDREIASLERRLAILRERPLVGSARAAAGKRQVSQATAASRRLQGRYLGLIRQIPAAHRGKFKKIAAAKGREEAVRALQKDLASRPNRG